MKKENFNLFTEIEHRPLRIYNRVVMSYNLREDFGELVSQDYIDCFSVADRKEMLLMTKLVQLKGKDEVMKLVQKGLVLPDEEGEEV